MRYLLQNLVSKFFLFYWDGLLLFFFHVSLIMFTSNIPKDLYRVTKKKKKKKKQQKNKNKTEPIIFFYYFYKNKAK